MAVLGPSEHASGAADLQIAHGDAVAAPELREFPDRGEPLFRILLQHPVLLIHQKRIGRARGTSHAAAELIQLGQSEPVRVVDDDRVDIRYVETRLDDRGGNQHVDLPVDKINHDLLELFLLHLSVRKRHAGLGHELPDSVRDAVDVIHAVVHIVDLTSPRELADNGLPYHLLVIFHDVGLDRLALSRRLLEKTHVADSHETHVERARDRRRRQCQHVDILPHLLDLFLVGHAEALLLIHNQQSQLVEMNILREQPVCSDDNVHAAIRQSPEHPLLLRGRDKTAQLADVHRIPVHPLREGVEVLLRKDGRRHQHRGLIAVLCRLEGRTDRDLRLSVADIPADKTVHDLPGLHIPLRVLDRGELILRLLIREHFFKLALPGCVGTEGMSPFRLPLCIQLHQVLRHLIDGLLHLSAGIAPLLRAKTVQLRLRVAARGIFLQHTEVVGQNIEEIAAPVLDLDVVLRDVIYLNLLDSAVNPDTVILVNDIVPHMQIIKRPDRAGTGVARLLFPDLRLLRAENIGVRDDRELQLRILEAVRGVAVENLHLARPQFPLRILAVERRRALIGQFLRQALCPRPGSGQNQNPRPVLPVF